MSEVFAQGVERNIQRFMRVIEGESAERRAQTISTLSSMVGALVLARATAAGNPELSEEILQTLREQLAPSTLG
jgi:TetR/AcrR family transcriptional repressor of nem operon